MNGDFFNFDKVIEIEKKKSYNQALEDLLKVMKERAEDCSDIPNMFDKGYSQAYEHMCYEAEQLKDKCLEMAEEHEQIAKWLEELKHYKKIENSNGRRFLTTEQIHDLCTEALIKGRADAIDDCKMILRSRHMFRTCEDDYNAKIEAPFYKGLWKAFDQLKEQKQ